jgi:protein-disulfide isomerase
MENPDKMIQKLYPWRSIMNFIWRRASLILLIIPFFITLLGCSSEVSALSDKDFEAKVLDVIRRNPKAILESVQAYNREQERQIQEARAKVLEQLTTNSRQLIAGSPVQGAQDAKIVLMEFSDFQCPFCARANSTVKEFMARNGNSVLLTYKHLPLVQIHPQALPASLASWAAHQQGKFWEYHDALFAQQGSLGEELFIKIANDLQLDISKFNKDRQSAQAKQAIDTDMRLAQDLGVNGTPAFFMNGVAFSGAVPLADMESVFRDVQANLAK